MSRGVRGFVAEILPRNTSMLRLAARTRGTMTTSRDEDGVHVTTLFPDRDARDEDTAGTSPTLTTPVVQGQ